MKKILILFILFFSSFEEDQLFAQSSNSIIVIGNKIGFESTSMKELKQIFRGKYSNWKNNEQVTIVLPSSKSESAVKVAFTLYNTSVSSMQRYWLSLVFQGRFSAPVFLETDLEIIAYVKKTPGAIGAISIDAVGVPKNLIINIAN